MHLEPNFFLKSSFLVLVFVKSRQMSLLNAEIIRHLRKMQLFYSLLTSFLRLFLSKIFFLIILCSMYIENKNLPCSFPAQKMGNDIDIIQQIADALQKVYNKLFGQVSSYEDTRPTRLHTELYSERLALC